MRSLLLLPASLLLIGNTDPQEIPDDVPPTIAAMLREAMKSGNEGEVATIVKYARKAAPDVSREIAEIASDWTRARREAATRRLRESDFFDLVKGRAEVGGFLTTGNTNQIGVTATVDLKREGFHWRHKVHLQADYQKSSGVETREHYLAAYEPNYKINDRAYVYGALQYESDRFLGYYDRYSFSSGAGYSVIKDPDMTLDLELGPAYRYTNFTDDTIESNVAGRGSMAFKWKLSSSVTLRQDASAYIQAANSTGTAKTSLSAKLFGPVSGQLSYQVQYESMPPEGRETTDTTSRASIVYDF
ncbi:DUF481 domain-containing protein [Stakelama saccharophila]|uniref:DUF481 domain-containing protein n=1 Tax=Stakelama saccharophila TaxID=3075605 RepID=A0ABZ0B6J2_9SPHN|nr:DUF481 domain-containing protein [Stakelama sp. W311]WNO52827.1 DUF481 domain-containing protein [Stakelama sp. W311]